MITPGTVDAYNPSVIPASPQGGNAIIAWDETGGGNSVHSDEYTNEFKIYAYINPTPFNNTTADTRRNRKRRFTGSARRTRCLARRTRPIC